MNLKIYEAYKGGHNSIALDPKSLNNALAEPLWMKETDSLSIIRGHIQGFKKPHIATSWGKDSTVMSHMVIQVCKELDIKPTNEKFPMFVLNHTRNIYVEELEYWKKITSFLEIPKEKFLITYPRGSKTVWSIAEDVG